MGRIHRGVLRQYRAEPFSLQQNGEFWNIFPISLGVSQGFPHAHHVNSNMPTTQFPRIVLYFRVRFCSSPTNHLALLAD